MDDTVMLRIAQFTHDIRTPLHVIGGAIKKMETADKDDETVKNARLSMEFILQLLEDVLDYTKISHSGVRLHITQLDKHMILDSVHAMIKEQMEEKKIRFHAEFRAAHPYFYMDKEKVLQIIINLLSNSVKYTNEGGSVSLSILTEEAEEYRDNLTIVVEDNGIGMEASFLKRAFEPFAVESAKRSDKHSGLGLSIVKELVSLMNGTIELKSSRGNGTKVVVNFMVDASDQCYKKRDPILTDQSDSEQFYEKKVLIAEDDEYNMKLLVTLLEQFGIQADLTYDGEEATEVFAESYDGEYMMIFMDILMPLKNGLEAAREIRNMNHSDATRIPIIAATGLDSQENSFLWKEYGINEVLLKPFHKDALYQVIKEYISDDKNEKCTK